MLETTFFVTAEEPEVRHYNQHSSFSVVQIAKGVKVLFHGDDHENDAEEFASRLQTLSGPQEIEDVELIVDNRAPSAAAR
jgi:hypothetical protein